MRAGVTQRHVWSSGGTRKQPKSGQLFGLGFDADWWQLIIMQTCFVLEKTGKNQHGNGLNRTQIYK